MKIALLADIHANLPALEAVWGAIHTHGVDAVWFLGDITDRGPNPIETVLWLRDKIHLNPGNEWVMGNHDAMLVNLLTEDQWQRVNTIHRADNARHRQLLEQAPEVWAFIAQEFSPARLLPRCRTIEGALFVLVHGGLVDHPGYYRYLYPWWEPPLYMEGEFEQLSAFSGGAAPKTIVCGHTHLQTLIVGGVNGEGKTAVKPIPVKPRNKYILSPESLWLINPGSVGQPRDMNRRAAYAILETSKAQHTVTFYRQEYDWRETARQLVRQGADPLYVEVLRDATADRDTPRLWLTSFKRAQEE